MRWISKTVRFPTRASLAGAVVAALLTGGWVSRAAGARVSGPASVPPPPDAIVLFDGRDLAGWQQVKSESPARWKVAGGALEVAPGTGDIRTKQQFSDFQLHVEFNEPYMPDARGQARGNSGVYLQGSYEIQVLDSYGLASKIDDCGAVYGQMAPLVNACRPPGVWQTYDILFHAARFDASGQPIEKARVSVLQNNIWIQDNTAIDGPTRASIERDVRQAGPIMLQDHGCRVRYRSIWIRPLTAATGVARRGVWSD